MKQITTLSHPDSRTGDTNAIDTKTMDSKARDFETLDFHSATGKLEYTLTNDFLFKSLLQKNKKVLKALVASLMHLKMEEITSIEITNPIELGSSVKDKTFYLDVRLVLNRNTIINLEMQVLNKGFWPERSIGYLARNFDHLERGEDYSSTKTVIHIGFLDFDLPDIPPEFYGTYKLLNVKNNAKYSDKLTLSVVNLRHIDLATEEDKKYHIDKWAALFKATTWEEIKMIAGKDEYLNEAASELFKRLTDLTVLEEYEARERYYRDQRRLSRLEQETVEKDKLLEKNKKDLEKNKKDLAKNKKDLAKNKQVLAEKDKAIDTLNGEIERLRELLAQNHISV